MAISKRLRYEVLRRDNHACRYCGATAPDVPLTIDHVVPVSLGGSDKPENLVTACKPCNSGKASSSPDAPVVADVSQDALRWRDAMHQAAAELLEDSSERQANHDCFEARWNDWTYPVGKHGRASVPLDPGWRNFVDAVLATGLPFSLLLECIEIAMGKAHVKPDGKFAYMAGCAWNKVTDMQDRAQEIANGA